ncbi:hypothetical protein OHC33_005967 [Knufia fluminis]|uniref:Cytochrome P450 n=1 Tax=Knufia fluminis TaxID=191047 RepID=A0AAN8EDG3_9EURO|nr:hypothetical protein OHC33_005967 [Knufia fluminis]
MTSNPQPPSPRPPPQLPFGNSNTFRGISENFAFHSSPESFIASRIQQWQAQNPSALDTRAPIRAKILNRNVAVVSSYRQIEQILNATDEDGEPPYIASKAYHELMTQFFPPPNLLLSDGCPHAKMRRGWDRRMEAFGSSPSDPHSSLSNAISSFFSDGGCVPLNQPVNLYETMKKLAWRVLLGSFLKLSPDDDEKIFEEVQRLHEVLLRGQFSLMPISVNTRFWQSPRSKGIQAREKLQELIMQRLEVLRSAGSEAPFAKIQEEDCIEEIRDHLLMMTSSLAVKGLASLLTAFFLNVFLFDREGVRVADELRSLDESGQTEERSRFLKSVCLETERLSPPIVGIMRRVARDVLISGSDSGTDTLLPAGWDVWMYFVGAGRDPAVFGETCMSFDPSRYMKDAAPEPLGFGAGPKVCLGKNFLRDIALLTAETCLASGLSLEGEVSKPGLKAWLGWNEAPPEQWAADVKQLPTQHPTAPVLVRFVRA